MTRRPHDRTRVLASMLAASVIAAAVSALPLRRPHHWTAGGVIQWVDHHGAPSVAAALLQAVIVAISLSIIAAGAASILAERSTLAGAAARRLGSPALVRWWAGGAVVASVAGAAPVAADDAGISSVDAPVLHDLGPSPSATELPLLRDLGSADDDRPSVVPAPSGPDLHLTDVRESDPVSARPAPDHLGGATWPVQHGDHLWHIAEETLRDAGIDASGDAVLQYWQQLIDANRTLVGDDIDLIHPGQVIHLPDVTAGS